MQRACATETTLEEAAHVQWIRRRSGDNGRSSGNCIRAGPISNIAVRISVRIWKVWRFLLPLRFCLFCCCYLLVIVLTCGFRRSRQHDTACCCVVHHHAIE
jgi:hypothetical protein